MIARRCNESADGRPQTTLVAAHESLMIPPPRRRLLTKAATPATAQSETRGAPAAISGGGTVRSSKSYAQADPAGSCRRGTGVPAAILFFVVAT